LIFKINAGYKSKRATGKMKGSIMNTKITGTGYFLPEYEADNAYLATLVETSDEWIRERTGIQSRHLAGKETTTTMAAEAAKRAIASAGIAPEAIDLILVATISPDMATPSTACQVQAQIGADRAVAFDINAACSGFLYALHTAEAFIRSGIYQNALLIGAETMSKLIDWTDRGTCVLFGDGAGAAVVQACEKGGILGQSLGSNGAKGSVLTCESRPSGNPLQAAKEQAGYLQMDGKEVFTFAVKTVPACIEEALQNAGVEKQEVKYYLLHQANRRIIQSVAKRLKVPEEQFPVNLDYCGNTSAASLPILLAQLAEEGKLVPGDKVVLSGFGGGLTWGACVMEV
jgi:3-oxoacyl-[acyl-carrier-protein] synthase-3